MDRRYQQVAIVITVVLAIAFGCSLEPNRVTLVDSEVACECRCEYPNRHGSRVGR